MDERLEKLITSPEITAHTAGLLALRKHKINEVVFAAQGLKPRVTPEVMSLLVLRAYHRQRMTRQYAQAVYLQGQIESRRKAIKALVEKAESGEATPEDVNEAERLQADVEELTRLLDLLDGTTEREE